MKPYSPEEVMDFSADSKRKTLEVLTQANQTSSRDPDDHYGELMVGGRDMYWNSDEDSEHTLEDYLDIL